MVGPISNNPQPVGGVGSKGEAQGPVDEEAVILMGDKIDPNKMGLTAEQQKLMDTLNEDIAVVVERINSGLE